MCETYDATANIYLSFDCVPFFLFYFFLLVVAPVWSAFGETVSLAWDPFARTTAYGSHAPFSTHPPLPGSTVNTVRILYTVKKMLTTHIQYTRMRAREQLTSHFYIYLLSRGWCFAAGALSLVFFLVNTRTFDIFTFVSGLLSPVRARVKHRYHRFHLECAIILSALELRDIR